MKKSFSEALRLAAQGIVLFYYKRYFCKGPLQHFLLTETILSPFMQKQILRIF